MRILYQLTSPMDKTIGPQEVRRRQQILQEYAASETEVAAEPTATGPVAIENARDAAVVVPELLRLGPLAQERGFDAIVIGCFSDPGIEPLRELLRIAVVGPGAAFRFRPGTVHRVTALEDTTILEVSTPQIDDIVRLEDAYGREGTSEP